MARTAGGAALKTRFKETSAMSNLTDLGRVLLIIVGAIVLLGLVLLAAGRIPFLGHLPGDISIRRGSTSFVFPIVTCLVLSAALTIIVNVVLFLFRKH